MKKVIDKTIKVGDIIIRDGYEKLIVTPKLLYAIQNGHVNNLNIKKYE